MGILSKFREDAHLSLELISAYLDAQVTSREREGADRHLEACDSCRRESASLQQTRNLLHAAIVQPVPRSFALLAVPESVPRILNWGPVLGLRVAAVASAAALALLLVSDGLLGTTDGSVPVQVGLAEPHPLITSGSQPSPELAVPLGTDSSLETSASLKEMSANAIMSESGSGNLVEKALTEFSLFSLEAGLLAAAFLFVTASFIFPRLRRS